MISRADIDLLAGDHHTHLHSPIFVTSMIVRTPAIAFAKPGQQRRGPLSRLDSARRQSVSLAASSIIMASRFLASSSCRLTISAILRSR
jgi:hypothetical protein